MKNILVCLDSFKDSISGIEANTIIANTIAEELPHAKINIINLSDGGPGFINAMLQNRQGCTIITKEVTGPLQNKISAQYAIFENTAIIEIAKSSGLELIPQNKRNPLITTSYGVGELILDALNKNVNKIIIGLGGSANNDGGAGLLQALGAKLLDKNNQELHFGGSNLVNLHNINLENLDTRLNNIIIEIASDVTNPLLGYNGATYIYAKQKGAKNDDIALLEKSLDNYANITKNIFKVDYINYPGSGAAGGLGYALLALGGELKSGINLVMEHNKFAQKLMTADYIFSGEGSIDEQTLSGKTISGIAKLCKKHKKPLIILTGKSLPNLESLYKIGVTAVFPIGNAETNLPTALQNAKDNLYRTTKNIMRILNFHN